MKRVYFGLAVAGAAAVLVGCSHEQKVTMSDLPPAVKATLDRETFGGKVTELEKEKKDGKVVYSADAVVNGQAWDIVIGEDGKLVSKTLEKDEHKK